MSAPAAAIAFASSSLKAYGVVKQAEFVGVANHVDFEAVAHAGLFEVLAKLAVDQSPTVGKFCTPEKPA